MTARSHPTTYRIEKGHRMSTVKVKDGTEIFYKDWGSGQPLFFHHGWPLSADDWDSQMMFFLAQGYRVIAHDRRGHGQLPQGLAGQDRIRHHRHHLRIGHRFRRGLHGLEQ